MLEECSKGNHQFKAVYRHYYGYDEAYVVRWCELCGSIKIDVEVDNRTFSERMMSLVSPQVSLDKFSKQK